ncbi:hypothetical protein SAMN05216184_102140 [Georgenia satyanarayanai]|uniref:Neocarzinostatin family protein n=1 Tax=Georgenia satyanarayanai TaxID=860221 RepID=A0A2Y9A461_9MICO|nr:hypothetical protein [Georgenia satyanarayanai]PYG00981.1 hypothetical protein A8987_102140 [Georgenia satyanarayanai]SSA39220.1 hypothetical protein SAMN05216184_102140 [Georgenia satyanarayanai]
MSRTPERAGQGQIGGRARGRLLAVTTAGSALVGALFVAAPAAAGTASGPDGQQVTVQPSSGLDPSGQQVSVSGSGFDTSKGIYVALCVDNGAGQQPGPCLGGVDMEGAGGASAWISSNPPAYGEGLAQPFTGSGGRGSFSVTLSVSAADSFTDCLDPAVAPNGCVIGTRADHTRGGDRSADVRVPVTFATGGPATGADAATTGNASGSGSGGAAATEADSDGSLATTGVTVGVIAGAAALLLAAGVAALRLRRRHSA